MSLMEYDPTMKKGGGNEFLQGKLIKAVNGAIIKIPFHYSIFSNRTYSIENSLMNKENIVPTETILTSNLKLNFANGDKVVLIEDGVEREMKVKTASKDIDENKAFLTSNPFTAWRVELQGG
jgi:hypothetical protein